MLYYTLTDFFLPLLIELIRVPLRNIAVESASPLALELVSCKPHVYV